MIVVGISPGLRTLTYCVLLFPEESAKPELRDVELLKGGRAKKSAHADELRKKANPHSLILNVVLERALEMNGELGCATVVAVGPSAKDTEPTEHDQIVRYLLRRMVESLKAAGFAIEHREWRTEKELRAFIGGDIRKAVNRAVTRATTTMRGPGMIFALAAALAGQRAGIELPKLPKKVEKALRVAGR